MKKIWAILLIAGFTGQVQAQRIGDPGVEFLDSEFYDPDYKDQMAEWAKAGVTGGIPIVESGNTFKTVDPTDTRGLQAIIDQAAQQALNTDQIQNIYLKPGTYNIDSTLLMKSKVRLIGLERSTVILKVTIRTNCIDISTCKVGQAIEFKGDVSYSGLDSLSIMGDQGTPDPSIMKNEKLDYVVTSVRIRKNANNCWLDKVTILNSGDHAVSMFKARHITFRDCEFDGAWNKGAGGKGYVNSQAAYCLYYNNTFRNLRHFGIQNAATEYNVIYKNFIYQDVNFHSGDNGNNLVEGNIITLPPTLGPNWHAIMGPWSQKHSISKNLNYVYKNICTENNNDGSVRGKNPWSDPSKIYTGSIMHEQQGNPFPGNDNIPLNGTLYPLASVAVPVTAITSVDKIAGERINIYPNPADGRQIYIQGLNAESDVKVSLMHTNGMSLSQWNKSGKHEWPLSFNGMLKPGIYLIKVQQGSHSIIQRLVVRR